MTYSRRDFIKNSSLASAAIGVPTIGAFEPSVLEQLQLAAVRQDGLVIQYIDNPSEVVQLVAV